MSKIHETMKKQPEKLKDFLEEYKSFIVDLFIYFLCVGAAIFIGLNVKSILVKTFPQVKYEFVTQDGEVKEGYGCRTSNGEGICIGDDGTKYFDIKSYKVIEELKESNEAKKY